MKNIRNCIFASLAILLLCSSSPAGRARRFVKQRLKQEPLNTAVCGILAVTAGGDTLVSHNAKTMMTPASNLKLMTTGLALHSLGADYCWQTGVGYDGSVCDSVLTGDLYIIGGGDPTIASDDLSAVSVDSTFAAWTELITEAGIRKIEGHIIGDDGYFEGVSIHKSWEYDDIESYYGAGISGLSFHDNKQFYDDEWANKFPADSCVVHFRDYLGRKGMECGMEAVSNRSFEEMYGCGSRHADSLTVLGSVPSPSLCKIAHSTNYESNNLFAETLFRTLGKEYCGSSVYDSAYVAVSGLLREIGLSDKGMRIVDGSGLSRHNLVSAEFICNFLRAMMEQPCFGEYIESIPAPGSRGTMEGFMRRCPDGSRERIRVKSGSMTGIRCYSGYIIPASGVKEDCIVFSIMINNAVCKGSVMQSFCEELISILSI